MMTCSRAAASASTRFTSSCRNETEANMKGEKTMSEWVNYAVGAAALYGLHQIFTKLAADRISDGLGGFVVEATAALTILLYLLWLRFGGRWNQTATGPGIRDSVLTGICVGAGTVVFFLLFQK